MIKLFWNTHNQKKPNSENKKIKEKQELDYNWGKYHKNSSDKWIHELLKNIKYKIIENENDVEQNDTLIIIDSSVEEKIELYTKLNLICSKIFLFHLGDEFGFYNIEPVYNNCNYIWRSFCANKYFNNKKVQCIPLGYKSGVIHKKGINRNEAQKYITSLFVALSEDSVINSKKHLKYLVSESQTPGGLNEQGVKELRKSGFYKSLEKSLNSILKRLNKV